MSATIVGSATKRDGSCAIRSSKGMPILDETYYFLVRCTAKDEPYVSVLNATGLPYVGVTVSPSGYGVCRSKSATRSTDNPLYWDVQCDFSSEVEERSDNQDPATDPTTWVPIYETKFERLSETVTKDLAGTSIANSAGQANLSPIDLKVGITTVNSTAVGISTIGASSNGFLVTNNSISVGNTSVNAIITPALTTLNGSLNVTGTTNVATFNVSGLTTFESIYVVDTSSSFFKVNTFIILRY